MQHLDEGTIHSWLDGALSVDEVARVEAHVKECPECAAAVAEARGFIAASSRILTALDNAPRGVIPAAAPRKRFDPFVLRVAATVLVVAAGTLVVFQNRGSDKSSTSIVADSALRMSAPIVGEGAAVATSPAATAPASTPPTANAQIGDATEAARRTNVAKAPSLAPSKQPRPEDERREDNARATGARTVEAAGSAGQQTAVSSGYAAEPAAPQVPPSNATSSMAMDMARAEEPLKVVSTPRRIGMKVTLYEVAPGDTVTLTEPMMLSLRDVVTTGATVAAKAASTERAMAPQSVARPDAAAAAAPDSQRGAVLQSAPVRTPAPPPPAPVRQVEVANGVTTISWTDATTRNLLKLSGRMSEARLQQIKIRIEKERAAAAKKTP
jgi:anti-sigma factor RsiW